MADCLYHARNFSKKALFKSGCFVSNYLWPFWVEVETRSVRLTSASSKQIYLTHEPSTFPVTGQTPRRPANSIKITFRKRHLASTDTLTGDGPVSPHQSAARWGPDTIPGPHSDLCVQPDTFPPMGYVPNPAPLLPTKSCSLLMLAQEGFGFHFQGPL